jgi:hypothetical protein
MSKKNVKITVSLDAETAELLDRISEEIAEDNRSQAARRAIQTAARVLLDPQPAYRAPARKVADVAYAG